MTSCRSSLTIVCRLRLARRSVKLVTKHISYATSWRTMRPMGMVLAKAQSLDAILVSLNGDFVDIVRYPPTEHGGIIALQLKGHPRTLTAILKILTVYLRNHPDRNE